MKDTRIRDDLYSVWREMNRRCYSEGCCNYHKYGAKGIRVCDEWKRACDGGHDGFKNFQEWALNNGYKKGLSIDRLNPYKDYSPNNCKWSTYKEQNRKLTLNIRNKSGYMGVSADNRRNKKWRVRVLKKQIGAFYTKQEAVEARNNYIKQNNLDIPIQPWIGEDGYTKESYKAVYK